MVLSIRYHPLGIPLFALCAALICLRAVLPGLGIRAADTVNSDRMLIWLTGAFLAVWVIRIADRSFGMGFFSA
jgi:hypothetical protein